MFTLSFFYKYTQNDREVKTILPGRLKLDFIKLYFWVQYPGASIPGLLFPMFRLLRSDVLLPITSTFCFQNGLFRWSLAMDLDFQDRLIQQQFGGSSVGSSESVSIDVIY